MPQKVYVVQCTMYDDMDMMEDNDIHEDAFTTLEAARTQAYTMAHEYAIGATGGERNGNIVTSQLKDPDNTEFSFGKMTCCVKTLNLK